MDDDPVVVVEFSMLLHGRTRDACIAKADEISRGVLDLIGGEPWLMLDDDFTRVQPPERLTIVDDQGFVYLGRRKYHFQGPLVPGQKFIEHPGHRTQGGGDADSGSL